MTAKAEACGWRGADGIQSRPAADSRILAVSTYQPAAPNIEPVHRDTIRCQAGDASPPMHVDASCCGLIDENLMQFRATCTDSGALCEHGLHRGLTVRETNPLKRRCRI